MPNSTSGRAASSLIVMRDPDGNDYPNPGVYLEVVENERSSSPTPITRAWEPSEKPFMTVMLTFEDLGGGQTSYTARALHWTVADREAHEKMGFHEGWGQCADQLAALLARGSWSISTSAPAAVKACGRIGARHAGARTKRSSR